MSEKLSAQQVRTLKARAKVLEFLRESGNVSYACKRAGIARQTYYDWRLDELFADMADDAIGMGKAFVNDLAHTKLIGLINEGEFPAVKFQLLSQHPDYQPRRPRQPDEEKPQQIGAIIVREYSPEAHEKEVGTERYQQSSGYRQEQEAKAADIPQDAPEPPPSPDTATPLPDASSE